MARGRKSLYKKDMMEQGYNLGAMGLEVSEIARGLNISERTIRRWMAKNPEFATEIKKGKENADTSVINSLYKQAIGGNTVACIFWLKNRKPDSWKDRAEIKGEGFANQSVFVIRANGNGDESKQDDKAKDFSGRFRL